MNMSSRLSRRPALEPPVNSPPDIHPEIDTYNGVVMFYPCLFCPSDNMWCSRPAYAPRCVHFSTVITPSWITQQISVENCMHRGVSVGRECETMFNIVTWTKQTWTTHHNTDITGIITYNCFTVNTAQNTLLLFEFREEKNTAKIEYTE